MPGAQVSARYSVIVRKYGHNNTRGLYGGKAKQVLAPLRLKQPIPPKAKKPKLPLSSEELLTRKRAGRLRMKAIPRCERKTSYASWAAAEAYAVREMDWIRTRREISLFAYQCRDCGYWHVRLCRARSRRAIS